jgi:hypothetical protein
MTKDAYWDELGIAWCAIHPETDTVMPRLKSRLRRQSFLIAVCLIIGLLLGIASAVLGAFTLWIGWTGGAWNFVTRGFALLAVSVILAIASFSLLPVSASGQARALPDMIDLTIARAERMLVAIRLGFLACAVVAVLGLVGTEMRTYSGRPPALSPILDLAVLAIMALGLFLYNRHVTVMLAKFQYLKDVLAKDGENRDVL